MGFITNLDFNNVFAVDVTDTDMLEVVHYHVRIGTTWAACIAALDDMGNTYSKECDAYPVAIPNKFWGVGTVTRELTKEEVDNLKQQYYTTQQELWLTYP